MDEELKDRLHRRVIELNNGREEKYCDQLRAKAAAVLEQPEARKLRDRIF